MAIPREHGAWAMLLQPFLAVLAVYRTVAWPVAPALVAVVVVFLVRHPLTVLARQRWVWRAERPETRVARRHLAVEVVLLALAGGLLLLAWPVWLLATMAGSAGALTLVAVYMTVHNRQRSIWLQGLSAAGLSTSGLAAALAIALTVPAWAWWLCGLHAAHFLAGILMVHARLEARAALRAPDLGLGPGFRRMRLEVSAVHLGLIVAAAAFFAAGRPLYGVAVASSAMFHAADLWSLDSARAVGRPLTSVGRRALAASVGFTLLLIIGSR